MLNLFIIRIIRQFGTRTLWCGQFEVLFLIIPKPRGWYLQRAAGLPDAAAWTTWLTTNLPLDLQNIELK